jgi:regulator of sirC expression with transglutaminase-like and TPR domain
MILVLERALEIEPEAPEYHRLLGRAWLAMGENDKAIVELNEFLRLAPDDPGAEVERQLVEALQKSQ